MKVHFIAIGGSAMHNLALALVLKGYSVSGSDDEIFEPAKSRLAKAGILPDKIGWDASRITPDIDAIILGMHAHADNPELEKAMALGLRIYSYPEFLYEQSKNKRRLVIGGSHGKTSITAMVLHAAQSNGVNVDYMVGAQLAGFGVMVKLSEEVDFMVFEGDEYLTSALDRRPKFHVYKPDVGLISGIAWDHMNVFPTFENYVEQFSLFARLIPDGGTLIYCADDKEVCKVAKNCSESVLLKPYNTPDYSIENGITIVNFEGRKYSMQVFGKHNMQNIEGARLVCESLGISSHQFYDAISHFKGASKRLELVAKNHLCAIYKDFAHSPSKLKATINAVKELFPNRKLIAVMELHTYSSLSSGFMKEYAETTGQADVMVIYYSRHALELKRLPELSLQQISEAFNRTDMQVISNKSDLEEFLYAQDYNNTNLLLMSSGNFDGIDIQELAVSVIQ